MAVPAHSPRDWLTPRSNTSPSRSPYTDMLDGEEAKNRFNGGLLGAVKIDIRVDDGEWVTKDARGGYVERLKIDVRKRLLGWVKNRCKGIVARG